MNTPSLRCYRAPVAPVAPLPLLPRRNGRPVRRPVAPYSAQAHRCAGQINAFDVCFTNICRRVVWVRGSDGRTFCDLDVERITLPLS